jgi:hypothetical protein
LAQTRATWLVAERPLRRLLLGDIATAVAAVLVGVLTGFWIWAEFLAGLTAVYLLSMALLWAARRIDERARSPRGAD